MADGEVQPPQMAIRDLEHRAAVLNVDRGFKDILRRLKWDLYVTWATAATPEDRETVHADLRALTRLEGAVATLASGAEINQRKDATAKLRRARAAGVDKSSTPR